MGGSSGGNSTTTQKADPWSGVQPYLTQGYQQLAGLYGNGAQGPAYYPGQTVATPNGLEAIGQQQQLEKQGVVDQLGNTGISNVNNMSNLGATGGAAGLGMANQGAGGLAGVAGQSMGGIGGAMSAMQQLNQAGDFQNNPAFQQALQSAIRPVTQQYQEQVVPGIRQGAQAAGQMGGSRQGIAEGIAARGYQDTVGDISANMGNAAYAQGLQALQASGQIGTNLGGLAGSAYSGLGNLGQSMYDAGNTALGRSAALIPGTQQAQLASGQIAQSVGQQRTADQQAQIDADMQRWNYGQNLPYSMIQDYLAALNGAQGGQTTSQQSGGGGSRATGALGGAATGAAIGGSFGGPMGAGIGAAGGALYGLFM